MCEFSTSWVQSLNSHKKKHVEIKPFKCEHCEYATWRLDILKMHMMRHDAQREKKNNAANAWLASTPQVILKSIQRLMKSTSLSHVIIAEKY